MANDARRAGSIGAQPPTSFEQLLRLLVDEQTYPRLHRLAGSRTTTAPDEHAEFLASIDCILDGVSRQ